MHISECQYSLLISTIMQKQNEGAIFIFGRIGSPHDPLAPHQPQLIFSQVMLGGLFVRSYRMLFKDKQHLCCAFVKRVERETQYLFMKCLDDRNGLPQQVYQQVGSSIDSVRKIKRIDPAATFSYRVLFVYLNDRNSVELSNSEFEAAVKEGAALPIPPPKDPEEEAQLQESEVECLDMMSGQELQKIKVFVWTYLDTFGQKYKDNLYYQFQKKAKNHLDIGRIIQTVDWIIYCQTVDKPYNQLESSNWTCFEAQSKQKCKSDRKEIVLTGCGRIMYVPLLFICEKLDHYKMECDRQLYEVMQESKKHYLEAEIKAYLITDKVDQHHLIYRTQSAPLHHYSALKPLD